MYICRPGQRFGLSGCGCFRALTISPSLSDLVRAGQLQGIAGNLLPDFLFPLPAVLHTDILHQVLQHVGYWVHYRTGQFWRILDGLIHEAYSNCIPDIRLDSHSLKLFTLALGFHFWPSWNWRMASGMAGSRYHQPYRQLR